MATSTKRVRLSMTKKDISLFRRRDLFLNLLSYLKMKQICYILTLNKEINTWINHYATNINQYFGLPLYNNKNKSLWTSINDLMSKSTPTTTAYIIPNITHKETLYFMSYKHPYLLLISWDHSFSIVKISPNNTNKYHPYKPTSISLTTLSKFGTNNHSNYFGTNKQKLFKFSNWEQFYSIDFSHFIDNKDEKLLIAFGGNINLYVAIFDIKTNTYNIISHAFEEPKEFNHSDNHSSRDRNQHWIRTCKVAPNEICNIDTNGYFLIVSGHGYDGEYLSVLTINKQCKIIYQNIKSKQDYNGCELQTRSIEFYYDKQYNIKLLIISITYNDKVNSLLIYSINCLKYKIELNLINQIDDINGNDLFGGAIAMRKNSKYLITTGEGGNVCLWKMNKDVLMKKLYIKGYKLFELITISANVYDDIWFINEIDFFHDDFFVFCSSSGMIVMYHIDENKLNIVKKWKSKNAFWSVACVDNYIFAGNEDGKLCSYAF
eukprot:109188_1